MSETAFGHGGWCEVGEVSPLASWVVFGQRVVVGADPIRNIAEFVALRLGLEAFPLVGKEPVRGHQWATTKALGRPGLQEAERQVWSAATGYGLVVPPGSDLVVLDFDSLSTLREFLEEFPGLLSCPMTYSGDIGLAVDGHCHVYVRLSGTLKLSGPLSVRDGEGRELVSLRGHGSYVAGPGSVYPGGVGRYGSNHSIVPLVLDEAQSVRLVSRFASKEGGLALRWGGGDWSASVERVAAALRERGYRQAGAWLNGTCVWSFRHRQGDRHPSFGYNFRSGVGFCFKCGVVTLPQVAQALGVPLDVQGLQGSPVFEGCCVVDVAGIRTELNVTVALFRRGCFQSARFYDVLCDAARRDQGQHTYEMGELTALGRRYSLSPDQVSKAVAQLVRLGLIVRLRRGVYRRVGLAGVRQVLGLGQEYGVVQMPLEAYAGSPADYVRNLMLVLERCLPTGMSSGRIAEALGISRRALYEHENRAGVVRRPRLERIHLATASDVSFIQVCAANGTKLACFSDGVQLAADVADQVGGKAWAWRQRPSERVVPALSVGPSC